MIVAWSTAVVAAALRGGAALLIAWIICSVSSVPAAVRCWAWRAAYLVLIVSFFWTTPLQLRWRRAASTLASVSVAAEKDVPASPSSVLPVQTSSSLIRRSIERAQWRPSFIAIGFDVWGAFVVAYLIRLFVQYRRAQSLRQGRAIESFEAVELARTLGVKVPSILTHPSARSPLLLGMWRPAIVLPEPVPAAADLRLILAHELSHLQRQDLLWNWLPTIAFALLPWHPLVWIGNRRFQLATEAAADAQALELTSTSVADYGRLLVNVAAMPMAGMLTVAVLAESRWILKKRLQAMTHLTRWNRRRLLMVAAAVGVVDVLFVIPWQVVAAPPAAGTRPVASPPQINSATPQITAPTTYAYTALGTVTLPVAASLRSLVSGSVVAVKVQQGDSVHQGDVMFQLDDHAQADALASGERIVKDCSDRYDFVQQQWKAGLSSQGDVLAAKLDLDHAQDTVRERRLEREERRIVSPAEGTVAAIAVSVGSTVLENEQLATLTQPAASTCEFQVPADRIQTLRRGTAIALKSTDAGTPLALGEVTSLDPAVDQQTNTVKVRARITSRAKDLWPGQFVNVQWNTSASSVEPDLMPAIQDVLHNVPFEQGASKFETGDNIAVNGLASEAGDYIVSGTYTLKSHDSAQLAASISARYAADAVGDWGMYQQTTVQRGSGTFKLRFKRAYAGWMHVSFYDNVSDFGGMYFGSGDWVLRKWPG